MKARITDIKRFAVHDGEGIRTTVFFKGCPLACRWCHNPEGIAPTPQLAYYAHKCLACGACAAVCACHTVKNGAHSLDRASCRACGACVTACPQEALTLWGREMTVAELMPLLTADRAFYEESHGGVTLSGGECLLQADFCAALLSALKEEGIRTAVDTCGYVPRSAIDAVLPYTDVFLYDIKAIDEAVHRRCTGHGNRPILDNLTYLSESGARVEIRIPYVPGFNDGEIEEIARMLSPLPGITGVRVLPYHNYAASKYAAVGRPSTLPETLPTEVELAAARALLTAHGLTCLQF